VAARAFQVIGWSVVVVVIAAGLFRPLWLAGPPFPQAESGSRWADVFGQSVVAQLAVAVLTAAAAIGGYLLVRAADERPPDFPPQFMPPPGLGPAQCEYIRAKHIDDAPAIISTVYDLANRKHVRLTQADDMTWTIRGLVDKSQWAALDPAAQTLGVVLELDAPAAEFALDRTEGRLGPRLGEAAEKMRHALLQWALAEGLVARRHWHLLFEAASFAAVMLAVVVFFWPREPTAPLHATMWGLPAAVFVAATYTLWLPSNRFRRTDKGRQLWARVGGFHRVLMTDTPETRVDFAARDELYTNYIPYAAAAGATVLWAEKCKAATGAYPPEPRWYQRSHFLPGGGVYTFTSAVSDVIDEYRTG
jgi:hypothetical protein